MEAGAETLAMTPALRRSRPGARCSRARETIPAGAAAPGPAASATAPAIERKARDIGTDATLVAGDCAPT